MTATIRVAMVTGVDIGNRGPHESVAVIEIKKANIGARYHFDCTVGDEVR